MQKFEIRAVSQAAAADGACIERDQTTQFWDNLNERLIGEFDSLAARQKQIPADEFNVDDNYKMYLNEVSQAFIIVTQKYALNFNESSDSTV